MITARILQRLAEVLGPAHYRSSPVPGGHWLALLGVLTVAVMTFVSRDITRTGEILAFVLGLISARCMFRSDAHWWLLLGVIAYAGWMLLIDLTVSITPEAINVEKYQRHYLKQYFFLFSGWWVGSARWWPNALLLAGLAGCLLGLAALSSSDHWQQAIAGRRTDFGFHNAQHTALYFGTGLFALIHLAGEAGKLAGRWSQAAALTACAAGMALCLFILTATQTRQTWLALAVSALVVLIALRPDRSLRARASRRARVAGAALMAAVVLALLVLTPLEDDWERTVGEWDDVAQLLDGQPPDRYSSITVRLLQWQTALHYIGQRPLTGYGGGSNTALIAMSTLPEPLRASYGHFHSSYLDSSLHYGLVGTALWLLGIVVLFGRAWVTARRGRTKTASAVFLLGWIPYFATLNVFESFINYESSYYAVFIAGGAIYGLTMPHRSPDPASVPFSARA